MMYQSINDTTNNNNEDEWILLVDDNSSQSIGIDAYSTTTTNETSTRASSDESFNSDDALALKILDDTYDFEAQKPFVLAYPIEEHNCCYNKSSIKAISSCTVKRNMTGYFFIVGVWIFMGAVLYILSRI